MKKVTLKFKKEDFKKEYTNSDSCAITTALRRSGVVGCQDVGLHIEDCESKEVSEPETYEKMTDKVFAMYIYKNEKYKDSNWVKKFTPIEPKDFQVTILLDI